MQSHRGISDGCTVIPVCLFNVPQFVFITVSGALEHRRELFKGFLKVILISSSF